LEAARASLYQDLYAEEKRLWSGKLLREITEERDNLIIRNAKMYIALHLLLPDAGGVCVEREENARRLSRAALARQLVPAATGLWMAQVGLGLIQRGQAIGSGPHQLPATEEETVAEIRLVL
jgi:hypothetical protein